MNRRMMNRVRVIIAVFTSRTALFPKLPFLVMALRSRPRRRSVAHAQGLTPRAGARLLRLWMIMSVLVCVELPGARVMPGPRDRPIDVCSRLSALVCLQAVNGDVCVCLFPSLDCIVEKKVASQRPIVPSLTCLTGTGKYPG